jgi:hypothetical protein
MLSFSNFELVPFSSSYSKKIDTNEPQIAIINFCCHHEDETRADTSMTLIPRQQVVPVKMRCTVRNLQQGLLILIGIAFLSPLLWMHRVVLPCTLTSLPEETANNTLEDFLARNIALAKKDVTDVVSEKTTRFLNESAMCQSLASTSSMALWVDNIDKIHDASVSAWIASGNSMI